MHYTGTIWRPPYEAYSALVQVTAGCTHHKCKFCTLYEDVPFKFRMSPLSEVEADLKESSRYYPNEREFSLQAQIRLYSALINLRLWRGW